MKRRILSLFTMVCMLTALLPIVRAETTIKVGDYVQMGTYMGKPIIWRCVSFEKILGYDKDGNPIMDATNTSTEYKEGYLPLMFSDKILCFKAFDASGDDTSGSHGWGKHPEDRKENGSNYWGDSNIRCWLNSNNENVVWACGNSPSLDKIRTVYKCDEYVNESGFLTNFSLEELNGIQTVNQKQLLSDEEYGVHNTVLSFTTSIDRVAANYQEAYSERVVDTMFLLDVQQIYNVYNNSELLDVNYWRSEVSDTLKMDYKNRFNMEINSALCATWLRTPGNQYIFDESDYVRFIGNGSDYRDIGCAYAKASYGIRPAFFLAENTSFATGNGTKTTPYTIGGGTATVPTTPEQTNDEYNFYIPSEMNIGDIYGAYVTYGHESLDSSSNFRFVEAQMTSSDENVVKLVKLGNSYRVQAAGKGTATVTASFEGKTKTQDVTVTAETAETLDDETVLKAKICADNGSYQYMRDAFEIPAAIYAKELDGTAAAANEAINAMIGAANGDYTVKNYYEIVLTEMLANEEFYNSIQKKYAVNQMTAVAGDAGSLVSTALEQYNKPVNQILQVPKDALNDAFDISRFAGTLEVENINAFDAIDALLLVNDTVGAFNEKYNQLRYLAMATQEQLSVLEGLANSSSGNEEFRDACKSVAGLIVETANMSLSEMKTEGVLIGLDNLAESLGSKAVGILRNLIPGMAVADIIVGSTKFITNALFNADALANDEIMLKAFEYIDNIVKREMKDSEDKFNSDPTAENAVEFMAYADFYQTLCAYGCDLAIQVINDYENAGVSGAWGEDVSSDKEAAERIKGYVTDWDFYNPKGTDIAKYLRVTVSTSPSGWAEEYVNKAIGLNILQDYMQNNYQNNITRAEFCSLMTFCLEAKTGESIDALIEKYGDPGLQVPFDDCMYTFAAFMSRLGIVNGVGNNNFNPLGEITRQEAAVMLMRAAEVLGYDVSAPSGNLDGAAGWAADGVNFVIDRGIMSGTENGFEPEGTYTKEQAVTTMVRFYENLGN